MVLARWCIAALAITSCVRLYVQGLVHLLFALWKYSTALEQAKKYLLYTLIFPDNTECHILLV